MQIQGKNGHGIVIACPVVELHALIFPVRKQNKTKQNKTKQK